MDAKLPDAVNQLLATRIDSFEKLEVVLALHGAPGWTMSVGELCRVLKLPRDVVRQAAVELRGVALAQLTARGEVRLVPPTSHDQAAIAELVKLYADDRFSIVRALGDLAVERIRTLASNTFGGSLVLRERKKDNEDD
jgi:hypothetical protein